MSGGRGHEGDVRVAKENLVGWVDGARRPGDEPAGDGGIINGVSQANCAYLPATDSTLPERRRRSMGVTRSGLEYRSPPGQLDQPVIPENNTCVVQAAADKKYASFDLKKGKTYRFRLVNTGTCLDYFTFGRCLTRDM